MPDIAEVIKKYKFIENKNLEAISNLESFSVQ